jgi:serine/threonine-protein kinase
MPDTFQVLSAALAGRYRVEHELGQGGMATVYLAEDLKHGRRVAIKVLHPELSAVIGSERFLAEIRTTASLQHPHILGLIDSGEASGLLYYVMPYIEGETLRGRLTREKQLSVDEAVRLTKEVASALEFAHKRGIVHRDIKPENILLQDGQALVADFGIALAVQQAGGTRMTQTGMSLGTPAYMSPEQATGERDLGPRSDVYALGAMTYEMLTGEPPFTGPNSQAIVARVLTEQPQAIRPRRPTVPPGVEAAVLSALQKLPADRFASARAYADGLDRRQFADTAIMAPASRRPFARPGLSLPVLVGVGAAAALAGWFLHRPPPRPVSAYHLAFAEGQAPVGEVKLTPDGSRLVYIGPGDDGPAIWVKNRAELKARPLAGTGRPSGLAISPDGREVAFAQNGKLKRVPLAGGPVVTIADSVFGAGTAWLDDGTLIYASLSFGLMQVPAAGGQARELWRSKDRERAPVISGTLPGSRGVFFSECTLNCTPVSNLFVHDFKTGTTHELGPGIISAFPLARGILGVLRPDGTLLGVPWDETRLAFRGAPIPVLSDMGAVRTELETFGSAGLPAISLSTSGDLIMRTSAAGTASARLWDLVWIDRSGAVTPLDTTWRFRLSQSNSNVGWAISPDGSQLAIGINAESGDDIWIKRLPNGPLSRLTFDSLPEERPRWTPDGLSVTYIIDGVRKYGMRRADGTGTSQEWAPSTTEQVNEVLTSSDGKWIVARIGGTSGLRGPRNIYAWQPGVDTVPRPVLASPVFDESAVALSPDGRWLAYTSDETGRSEVYVRPFPNVDSGKWQVSVNGGQGPQWARSGREFFYLDAARNMMSVPVTPGPSLVMGLPVKLFTVPPRIFFNDPAFYAEYDVSRDGTRFLMARDASEVEKVPVSHVLVENWASTVAARMKGAAPNP